MRSAKARAQILKATRTLLISSSKPPTVRAIAAKAKYSPGLVIQLFGNKAGLIHEIFRQSNKDLLRVLEDKADTAQSPEELILIAIEALLGRDLAFPQITRQIMAFTWSWGPEEEAKFRETLKDMSAIIANSLVSHYLPQDEELVRAASFSLINIYVGILRIALQEDWSAQEVLERITPSVRLVLTGLKHMTGETGTP